MSGIVYLVGAGPGDPGLLTLRGAQLLKRAEALVYDDLVAPDIVALAPDDCRRLYVGKRRGRQAMSQEEINRLLITEARADRRVVRLKGGDPYIFGRGGEEALALAEAGLRFEVIPGISSTVAAAAYAGIPLTHRHCSSQAVLTTGHEDPLKARTSHDWAALAKMGTISMVMGVTNLEYIARSLTDGGRSPETPAALIQWGTTARQRTLAAPLGELADRARAAGFDSPALLVIGEVTALRERLNWFETRPLFGRRILVTRARNQQSVLSEILRDLGAEVWEKPTIELRPLSDPPDLDQTLQNLDEYRWLVFTSANGVEFFMHALGNQDLDTRALAPLKIAVIGPGTAQALLSHGLKADLAPAGFQAEGLLEALKQQDIAGQKILLARALDGREVLPNGLLQAGAVVRDLPLYKTVNPVWTEPLPQPPDLVTLTSSSTATGLAALTPPEYRPDYPVASIGPITTATAVSLGFPVVAEAPQATIEGLVTALTGYFQGRQP